MAHAPRFGWSKVLSTTARHATCPVKLCLICAIQNGARAAMNAAGIPRSTRPVGAIVCDAQLRVAPGVTSAT